MKWSNDEMGLENLDLLVYGVENRIEKFKKNSTFKYDLEILEDLGFMVEVGKIRIKIWVLNEFSIIPHLEQEYNISFCNFDLDKVFFAKNVLELEKDLFANGAIELGDFNKIVRRFWEAWKFFACEVTKNAYYYLKRKNYNELMKGFKSKIAIGYNW